MIDQAALGLLAESRAFTRRNLYYAVRRATLAEGTPYPLSCEEFCEGPLSARLRSGPVPGLLPPTFPAPRRRLPPEWDAYFPAAILLLDKPALVGLVAASSALVQARVAPIALDGTPAHVVRWLRRGYESGQRAPIAYVHDATTLCYPFLCEPLATLVEVNRDEPLPYKDVGLPPSGRPASAFPFTSGLSQQEQIVELEQLPPAAFVAYAVRSALRLVLPDPLLAPLKSTRRSKR